MPLVSLPIDAVIPAVLEALARDGSVVLEAPPGTGKTTRVPRACLDAAAYAGREIVVLEPRRLAAKLAAVRVADELGEEVGAQVGYHFRFENVGSARTRIRFVTEGMFLRRLLADPELAKTAVVIIDEFHERHLQGDLALAWVRRLQQTTRPDLKVVVMSATLDGAAVADYFGCSVVKAEGRRFPVDIEYLGDTPRDALDDTIAKTMANLVQSGHKGDALVFLPGVAEIRRAEAALQRRLGDSLLILPLYADLPKREQERAVSPGERQKVVLATNVAETSVTIEGITAVIDSGLARVAQHNWWSGLPVLRLAKISQASSTQRAGRAGRTAPGRCLRLYSQADHAGRPSFERPEVQRLDLTQPVLELKAMGADLAAFPWYEAPPSAALEAAEQLLYRLGAVDAAGAITALGRRMAGLPAHPRLARLAIEAARLEIPLEGCTAAAWLGESPGDDPDNEIAGLVEAVQRATAGRHNRISGWHAVERVRKQLLQGLRADERPARGDFAVPLRKAVLAGFPDRVGRLRAVGKTLSRNRSGEAVEVVLCGGGSARLLNPHLESGVEYVTALDAEERTQGGLKGDVRLRMVGAVEADWLLELEPMLVEDKVEAVWNDAQERADVLTRLTYDRLTLSESKVTEPTGPQLEAASALLQRKAQETGLEAFADRDELAHLRSRIEFLSTAAPDLGVPAWAAFEKTVWAQLCEGRTRFSELREAGVLDAIRAALPDTVRRRLDEWAPSSLQLPGGRRLRIEYEPGKPPWAESRLQDFFGMRATPTLAAGRVPLVLHLLAPNKRAVQVTTDLAGFWARTYPQLRRELSRNYPKHSWPEDPLRAEPPRPGRLR